MRQLKPIIFLLCSGLSFFSCSSARDESDEIIPSAGKSLFSFFGSSREELAPAEYMHWVENKDNGLMTQSEIGEYVYSAFYKPLAYTVLKDWDQFPVEEKKFRKEMEEYKGLQYYTLTIESKKGDNAELLRYDLQSNEDYFSRIEYYSFQVQNDIKLVEGEDTLACRIAHFERAYGLQSKVKIVIGFDKTKEDLAQKNERTKKNKTLLFDDKVFGAGLVKLTIDKETLNSIPELKLS